MFVVLTALLITVMRLSKSAHQIARGVLLLCEIQEKISGDTSGHAIAEELSKLRKAGERF
jgi:hypothetical protein